MTYTTGLLKAVCVCMVILVQRMDAGHAPKEHAAGVSCNPRELTALTKHRVEASLASFDKANGEHLGIWHPGFPELKVHQNSPLQGSKVQCSLLFMAQGLGKILEDQRANLNPENLALHLKLKNTISTINMLAECMKQIHGGECSPKPSPPIMPNTVFGKKQWSHTLLKTAKVYLDWLELKLGVQKVKGIIKIKRIVPEATRQRYLEGSGHLL